MRDNNLWNPRLIVAMPDHVHLIADIPRTVGIGRSIRLFKAKTAHTGQIKWQ
jgi:REP element-mobilizing transposase RayT